MIEVPEPVDRIDNGLKDAEIVVLGLVTNERDTDDDPSSPGYFESTVSVLAVLAGDLAESELAIPYLGENCPGGGSRLHPGERVLMMLHQTCYASRAGIPEDCHWALSALGGKIQLFPTRAVLDDIGYEATFVGVPDAVVRDIGRRAGADEARIEAALQAAAIRPAKSLAALPIVVGAAIVALVGLLAIARLRVHRGLR